MNLQFLRGLRPGHSYAVKIEDLSHDGEGVGRYKNMVVFVKGAMPGDWAITEITRVTNKYARGKLIRLLEPSPQRILPRPCSLYECGGCQLLGMSYEAQLAWKTKRLKEALARIGKLTEIPVKDCLPAPSPTAYRNKAEYHVTGREERFTLGFTAYHSHAIIPLPEENPCYLVHPAIYQLALGVKRHASEEVKRWLRSVLIRHAPTTNQSMVVLVFDHRLAYPELGLDFPVPERGQSKPQWSGVVRIHDPERISPSSPVLPLWEKLKEENPSLASFGVCINTFQNGPGVIGEVHLIAGQPYIEEVLDGLTFRISPASFFQVNTEQALNLYRLVEQYAELTGSELALDAYSGIGTIALYLARKAKEVLGIEIIAAAVEDARTNARLNGLRNARFVREFVEKALPALVHQGNRPDVVVLDPPRAGVEKRALQAILEAQPPRIIYVSCDAATLARDLGILVQGGYRIEEVQPVDMFPQTSHTEAVALVVHRGFPQD